MNTLFIGETYMTHSGIAVTPIKQLSSNTALFVSGEFIPTPFVVWEYDFSDNHIEVYSGEYFRTLEEAIAYVNGET